jgi:hypothetical protein
VSEHPERDPGVIGTFWFRRADFFLEAADELLRSNQRVRGEFYVDSCINQLIAQKRRAVLFDVDRYVSFGTPDDLKTWEYWNEYFRGRRRFEMR